MPLIRMFGIVLMTLTLALPAWSATLSEGDVENFISSMHELKPYFNDSESMDEEDETPGDSSRMVQSWVQELSEQHKVESILDAHGYNLESWSVLAQQVVQAYMAVKLGQNGQNVVGQMEESRKAIETSKDMPQEYKAQMLAQIDAGIAELKKNLDAPTADQDAVKPHLGELDTLFEWQE